MYYLRQNTQKKYPWLLYYVDKGMAYGKEVASFSSPKEVYHFFRFLVGKFKSWQEIEEMISLGKAIENNDGRVPRQFKNERSF